MKYRTLLLIVCFSLLVCCLSACGKTGQPDNESSSLVASTAVHSSADTTEMLPSQTTETTKTSETDQTDPVQTEEQSTVEAQNAESAPSVTEAEQEPSSSVSESVPETPSVAPSSESQGESNSDGLMQPAWPYARDRSPWN